MSLRNTSMQVSLDYGETISSGLISSIPVNATYSKSFALTDGTGSGKAQKVATQSLEIDISSPLTVDLTAAAGGVTGGTVNFSKVKLLIVENTHATGNLEVGGAGSNAFSAFVKDPSDIVLVKLGESKTLVMSAAGETVDGTHKNLLITSTADNCTGKLVIIGEGA